jgi:hypothetical protein
MIGRIYATDFVVAPNGFALNRQPLHLTHNRMWSPAIDGSFLLFLAGGRNLFPGSRTKRRTQQHGN